MRHTSIPLALALLAAIPTIASAAGSLQLPASGQTSCFDSAGAPRACAGTGEDGDKKAGVAWPVPRFEDNGDGTVSDLLTGLTWSKHANAPDLNAAPPFVCANAESDMSWQQALDYIECLNQNEFAGSKDWRLPNLNELESMAHAGAADSSASLSANGFGLEGLVTLVQPFQYWSSTSDAAFPDAAWDLDFVSGGIPFSSVKIPATPGLDTRGVWPVSGVSTGPAALAATGQTSCFSANGGATACSDSGQDGEELAGVPLPAPRFKTSQDESLTFDRVTGLVWTTASKTPAPAVPANPAGCAAAGTPLDWQQALDHVACLNRNSYLGSADWRLPNRKELRSLADYSRSAPALPAGHPFGDLLSGDTFWSSTSDAAAPQQAWTVNMVDGSLNPVGKANTGVVSAWPVTGPDLAPPALSIAQSNMTINRASRSISGTVEPGAEVKVAVNGGAPAAATVEGGTWSFTVDPLVSGANLVAVTASDFSENQSSASLDITFVVPDGVLSGGAEVTIGDALIALRIAVEIVEPTADQMLRGDVSPPGAPDGSINVADALMILRKTVGLEIF